MAKYVVLLGAPGAGKGTQAKKLEQSLGLPQVATGDLFRENLKNETELGKLARTFMDAGELVPDEVTVGMVRDRISRPDCVAGVIFDGFPRTASQAAALEALLTAQGERVSVAPFIKVDEQLLLKRLGGRWTCKQCGHVYHILYNPPQTAGVCDLDGSPLYQRADDTEETQRRRIEVFFEQTMPVFDFYRDRGLLVEIDGEQAIEAVNAALLEVIENAP